MSEEKRKHNWFSIQGDIRTKKDMTTKEFIELMDKLELDFSGEVCYSTITDEDYK